MCGEGMRFPPHLHPELELFWLESGSLYIDGREDSVILEAGTSPFLPNDVHGYRSAGDNDRYRMAICSSPLLVISFPRSRSTGPRSPSCALPASSGHFLRHAPAVPGHAGRQRSAAALCCT